MAIDLTTVQTNLQSEINGYLAILIADSSNPQPSYSIDGKSVSRNEWRSGMQDMISKATENLVTINKTIIALNPYIITHVQRM